MKKTLLAAMVVSVAGQYRSCGNCRVEGEFAGRCNTGSPDLVPYNNTASVPSGDLNGTNVAEALPIGDIQTLVGESWKTMFCSGYIARYRDGYGSEMGEGAACVRSNTKASILAADKEARDNFNKFGTSNGYASSFAVSKGVSDDMVRYGVDGTGDVPSNWCGVYMRYMMCHIAFPQVVIPKDELAALRASGPFTAQSTTRDIHYIRTVSKGSCETLFDVCNRREPTTDETKESFQPDELVGFRPQYFLNNNTRRKMESDAWCAMWGDGFGLSLAGTGVSDGNFTMEFEAAGQLTYSLIAVVTMLVAVMM